MDRKEELPYINEIKYHINTQEEYHARIDQNLVEIGTIYLYRPLFRP